MRRRTQSQTTVPGSASEEKAMMNVRQPATRHRGPLAALAVAAALLALALAAVAPAAAEEFGVSKFDVQFSEADATPGNPYDDPPATQAGSHPFAMTTTFNLNYSGAFLNAKPGGHLKTAIVEQVRGFTGNATAMPRCKLVDFLQQENIIATPACPDNTAVGVAAIAISVPPFNYIAPVYNLETAYGEVTRLGFSIGGVTALLDVTLKSGSDPKVVATSPYTSQYTNVFGAVVQLWGVPADPAHDHLRGSCLNPGEVSFGFIDFEAAANGGTCSAHLPERPLLNLPTACEGPASSAYRADPWEHPGAFVEGSALTHDNAEPPNPIGFSGCGKVPFSPATEAAPSTSSAESPSGLDFSIGFNQEGGLLNPDGIAQSTLKRIVTTLPKGVTINPSVGEGLGYCTRADYERESLDIAEGEGCPNDSKIGTVSVQTPLVEREELKGSLYLAQQGDPATPELENPFDSLIAFYIVIRDEREGILVKVPVKVEPDPHTGQLITTAENLPQTPFSRFNLHFREGQRSPLTTPPACGSYDVVSKLTPWSDPGRVLTQASTFKVTSGIAGGPCPPGGIPPFKPDFEAGSINNNAASYSPFDMRLIRHDGEQDMTKFGSVLPPGVVGNLSGVAKCSDAEIAAARAKTGREELASPSCPANSQIGRTIAGAGVGPALTYVPGRVYLGGAYHGDPLSVISVTPAVAGPFDAGDVVVHIALTLNPKTAEVEVDGASSDPIPHILKGIPLKVRDLRVYVDRQNFILNPTSCDESSAKATLFGSYLDVFDPADDIPVDLSTRYQAANCLNLGFKPHLGLHLKGGTRRGAYPGLKAVYSPKKGDANIKGLVVRLPRSAFLEQGHIRTICTRVQYAAQNCPSAARYGYIKAWTPLLEEPLQGPVWLRSSSHKLPDLVFDLRGLVNVEVSTRIDSVHGGIRARVEDAPDAPISRVLLNMQGGKKGLIVNSRNLCFKPGRNHANVQGTGQNGKQFAAKPLMQTRCSKARKHKRHQRRSGRARVARSSRVS